MDHFIFLLVFYIQDPCCSISITKFDSIEECNAAWDAIEKFPRWQNDRVKVFTRGCTFYKAKVK